MDCCSKGSNNTFTSVISSQSPAENLVRMSVLLRLSKGLTTNIKDLSVLENLIEINIPLRLQRLSELDLVHFDPNDEQITVAYPFSGIPTAYRVEVGNTFTYAMCAIDALGISHMMQTETMIKTECAHCGKQIRLHVTPKNLEAVPSTVLVGVKQSDAQSSCCSTENSSYATNCCPGIQFYCSNEHWNKVTGRGNYLSLTDAYKYAKKEFGALLYQGVKNIFVTNPMCNE